MVASVKSLSSAGQAASYYEADDYYTEGDEAPSAWFGEAAASLGLTGEVDRSVFAAGLFGKLPGGTELGTVRSGVREHRPGWDMTFSAPKSVSIMAEVAGDRRLISAHDKAVKVALDFVERHGAATRARTGGQVRTVATGKLAVATFRHDTSRKLDPQLHTHAVILNATQDKDGVWRSVESLSFFKIYKDAGAVYRQSLASEAQTLGYAVKQGKDSLFELAAVPDNVIKAFSARGNQIEAALAERGKTRATATAAEKGVIALATRDKKVDAERGDLMATWRAQADRLGFGAEERLAVTQSATKDSAKVKPLQAQGRGEAAATEAVAAAARSLTERSAVVPASALERRAGDFAFGRASASDIRSAIASAQKGGELVARVHSDNRGVEARGFTTRAAIQTEKRMLALEARGRGSITPEFDRMAASRFVSIATMRREEQGFTWTSGQRQATIGLLASGDKVVGVQGYAGTAKTTTVLATYADAMRSKGHTVRAFAPTANAAALLGEAIGTGKEGTEGRTVASLTRSGERIVTEAKASAREVWIVDEASMVSARDMVRVLDLAERGNARLVLVGDVKQLGSVEAGRAFGQLQDAGMPTFKLDEIVRQTNDLTREAVLATIAGDGRRALAALDKGGGKVVELPQASDRYAAMAKDYAALSPNERARTLVMDPTRAGRDHLTDAIRTELKRDGTLGVEAIKATVLDSRGLTKEEARHARSYELGDAVTFRRDYGARGIEKGQAYRIEKIDPDRNRIELRDRENRPIDWQLDKWGRGQSETFARGEREFRSGDRVQFTRNDREAGRVNGQVTTVQAVDLDSRSLFVRGKDGVEHPLQIDRTADQHIRHGWVGTIHSSQGATADRAMAHLESFRANTVDARSSYVALSRAKEGAALYTDSKEGLAAAIEGRSGEQHAALSITGPTATGKSRGSSLG
jgi:conjugative relaxase-like TrwC/TraI family protein